MVPAGDDMSAPRGFDGELWKAMAEQGWPAIEVPEERGGLGLGMVEVAVLCEEIGHHLAPAPFLPTVLALGVVQSAKDRASGPRPDDGDGVGRLDDWCDVWIERLSSGDAVGAVAWSPAATLAVRRSPDASTAEIDGRTDPVPYGPSADLLIVCTPDEVMAVEGHVMDRPIAQPAMDRTRELGIFAFDGRPARRLGGRPAVDHLLDRAATGASAEMLGAAAAVLDMSVQYAKDRVQFGRPIGSFQAVKHELADALVDVEGMRSTAYYAAWCTANDDPEASLAASMAKAWCSDAARRVMATGLQVHGGIGFTWEHDMHLYLKRSQLDQVTFGDAPWHRSRIAGQLRQRLGQGQGVL